MLGTEEREKENLRFLQAVTFKHERVIKSIRKELRKQKKKINKLNEKIKHDTLLLEDELTP